MPRLMRRPARAGYTLTEMLIVMMILAIIGTALMRVLVKSQQSFKDSTNQSAMQRELRLTGSYLPAEMRSSSSAGGDVRTMQEGEFEFLANIGSGIVCAKPGVSQVEIPPLAASGITLTNWYTQPGVGDSVYLYNEGLLMGSEDDVWEGRRISSISSSTAYCTSATFRLAADAAKPGWRVNLTGGPLPDSVKLGAVVRFARPVRYKLYQAGSGEWYMGYQEYLNGSWSTIDAVGGPFRAFQSGDANPSGLQFRYFDSTGVRLTSTSDPRNLSRVDVYLRTNAGVANVTERRPNLVRDSVLMRVGLRNFK